MKKNKAVLNLLFCSIIHGLNHYLIIFYKPIYPYMKDYFHLNNVGDLTTKLTIIYLGYGFSNFLAGIFSKKISLKLILFFGMLIMSMATIAVYFVNPGSFSLMVVFVFLMGLGGGTYHPAANTLVTSTYEGNMGFAIGVLSIGSAVGFIAAPFIGEYIGLRMIGFRNLFLISGIISLLFSFSILFFITDNKAIYKLKTNVLQIPDKKKKKIFILLIILICIPVTIREIIGWSYYEIIPFWVYSGFSSGITISVLQMMQYLPGLIVQPLTGKLCDLLKPIRIIIISFFITAAGFIIFAFHGLGFVWLAMIFFGIGMAASTVASETYMAGLVSSKNRALLYGIVLSVGLSFGGKIAGYSGKVVDIFGKDKVAGYNIWFILMGILLIISIIIYYFIEKLRKIKI